MLKENAELEFGRWLDACLNDARGKLGLSWAEIAFHLLGKAQKAVLLEINKSQT